MTQLRLYAVLIICFMPVVTVAQQTRVVAVRTARVLDVRTGQMITLRDLPQLEFVSDQRREAGEQPLLGGTELPDPAIDRAERPDIVAVRGPQRRAQI